MSDDNTGQISPEHIAFLEAQAVDVELAKRLGVRSLLTRADNPQEGIWANWANHPALAFPWVGPDGVQEWQIRPDEPTTDNKGKTRKYVFSREAKPMLWAVQVAEDPRLVLIVEGTKQCLAAASHAPADVSVYGIAGCRMWQVGGMPIPDLHVADGCHVVVILDADAAENPDVFKAGTEMGDALTMEGAESVLFTRLPKAGKSGLDDILGKRAPARRAEYLRRLIAGAKPKPADKAPVRKRGDGPPSGERPLVVVNEDRFDVINNLTGQLVGRWDATELFCHGGVISRLKGGEMKPVDKGSFNDVVQSTVRTMNKAESANGTTYSFSWPDAATMMATMSRAEAFSPLDRIAHAPFVRSDGTVVTAPGYDTDSRTMLVPAPVFEGLEVPETPTGEQITAARQLLMDEWLGDFPFDTDADRANVMALLVTPAVRGLLPKVPMAVIDGLQMGVGKNLLADALLTVYTGDAARPMNWVDENDEVRKQITAAFRQGNEFFVFDEAHKLQGAALAQALTAETWQDRILGVSTMADFPNRVTWLALGNQVEVKGDITRRVYRISLRPRYANPQDRKASSFRHPGASGLDLLSWTRKNRAPLMAAILTLVRAWYAAGSPLPEKGVSFGSFEIWERIVGGIVGTAGMQDFLGNLKVWRSESDFDTQYWAGHLGWLREQFGTGEFRTAHVRDKALAAPAEFLAPPRLDDPAEKTWGKALGEAYSRIRERRFGEVWIERVSNAHGHVSLWTVRSTDDLPPPPEGPAAPEPDPDPDTAPSTPEETVDEIPIGVHGSDGSIAYADDPMPVNVVTFDLETHDADDLYRMPGEEFIRIGATAVGDAPVRDFDEDVAWNVTADVLRSRTGATVTGHNIMAFDLPALVRAGQMTMMDVHEAAAEGRLFDGLLAARFIDPPMAREHGVDQKRKYDLKVSAERYGLGEKLTEVSGSLEKKYGGFGLIPIDLDDPDPERAADAAAFRRYMVTDVELSRDLHAALMRELGGTVPEYLAREHRVAALGAQISMNGFLVDEPLLRQRVAEVEALKARSLAWLEKNIGLPLADAKGVPYKAPLASKAGKEAVGAALVKYGVSEKALWRTPKSKDLQLNADAMAFYMAEYRGRPAVQRIAMHVDRIVGARSVYQTALDNLCPDGRVHPRVGFDQATGRWSVTRPGLTVFGKRGGRHVERAVFLPDPGEVLISADLSQVDMRAVAGLSQDQAYIRMLMAEDPHAEIAEALFGDRSKREVAKPIGHGWNYGRSIKAISEGEEIDPALVRQFDSSMRERFPRLVEWQGEVRALAESGALLDNGFGRKMRPDPQRAWTQGPALMGQGAARDIMMTGLLNLPAEILPMLRAQVHDEIVLSVPAADAEEIGREVVKALSFEWRGVPILADVSRTGTDWSKCYEKD